MANQKVAMPAVASTLHVDPSKRFPPKSVSRQDVRNGRLLLRQLRENAK